MGRSYERTTAFLQEKIKAVLDRPLTSRQLSIEADIEFTHVQYYLKKLIARGEVLCVEDKTKAAKERWMYLAVTDGSGGKMTLNDNLTEYVKVEKFDQCKPKGAMARVENLADKLKAQSKLINKDRHTSIQRSRGGCAGVSQVYEG